MKKAQRDRLSKAGWRTGSVQEFLELTDAQAEFLELKLRLADALKATRQRAHMTQAALATMLGSSQPRIARMEAGDASVSIDLLVRSLLATGWSAAQLGKVVGTQGRLRAA